MKKILSILVTFVLVICLVPVSALPVYADTVLRNINIEYDTKAVALREDLTGKQVSAYLQKALKNESLNEGVHFDTRCTHLVEKVTYQDGTFYFRSLRESEDLLSNTKEYYFLFNLEENDGYLWDPSALPSATVNGSSAEYIR